MIEDEDSWAEEIENRDNLEDNIEQVQLDLNAFVFHMKERQYTSARHMLERIQQDCRRLEKIRLRFLRKQ